MDGEGNFNEPDGYIDHFQSVHVGEGAETGGGARLGRCAACYSVPPAGFEPAACGLGNHRSIP